MYYYYYISVSLSYMSSMTKAYYLSGIHIKSICLIMNLPDFRVCPYSWICHSAGPCFTYSEGIDPVLQRQEGENMRKNLLWQVHHTDKFIFIYKCLS